MNRIFNVCILIILLAAAPQLLAQEDSTKMAHKPVSKLVPKPRVGLGVGTLTFYGDVGRNQRSYGIGTSDFAQRISLSYPVDKHFEIGLHATFSTITLRETNTPELYNFQSRVSMYTAEVAYNFGHFLPEKHRFKPFLSTGFSSIEFLTKTDMFDAEGRAYHIWSDGTYRDQPESSFNATQSTILSTDYTYETDVRELQESNFGKYAERTFAIPITVGANLRLSDRFHGRMSATHHLTFTDLIDNVGRDQGRNVNNNDQLLFIGVGLTYDLSITPKNADEYLLIEDENGAGYLSINWDGDNDGVHDLVDECLGTPAGVPVDAKGCPLDDDGDKVPNYRDDELDSPEGSTVSNRGVAISDEQFYKNYLFWTNKIPFSEWNRDYRSVFGERPEGHIYTVRIASENEEFTQEQINALLGSEDLRVVSEDGNRVYVSGEFADIKDALQRKIELQQGGLSPEVKEEVLDKSSGVKSLTEPEIDRSDLKAIEEELKESISTEENLVKRDQGVIYRVQIGAYENDISPDFFSDVPNLMVLKGTDGLTRYSSGGYSNIEDAAAHKINMVVAGFSDCFITAYEGGKRVTLRSTGVNVVAGAADPIVDSAFNGIDKERIQFEVNLGNFTGDVPTEMLDKYLQLGSVTPKKQVDGSFDYVVQVKGGLSNAESKLKKAKDMGIAKAKLSATFNDKEISLMEAKQLLELR